MSSCSGGGCCSADCSCPSDKPDRRPLSNCCYCKADEDGCPPGSPVALSTFLADLDPPYNKGCGCTCPNDDAGIEGAYVYTTTEVPIYDAEGTQIGTETKNSGKEWEGEDECPKHIPDLVECKCKCLIKENDGPCEPDFIPNPSDDACDCICGLDDSACPPNEPKVDTSSCECVCDVTADDCTGGTPDFDPDICDCYCAHERNGDCPADKPFINPDCECYCPISADDCDTGTKFDSATCSCLPCPNSCSGCQTQDDNCDCLGCEGCNDTQYCFGDPETCICCPDGQTECDGACVDNICPGGQTFDPSSCQCECDGDKVICNGKCHDPCPPGEGFDANCKCSAAYASSILSAKLLP